MRWGCGEALVNETADSGRRSRFLLGVIAFILVIAAMREAQSLVVPLLLALYAALIAAPAVAGLERKNVPIWAAVLLVMALQDVGNDRSD